MPPAPAQPAPAGQVLVPVQPAPVQPAPAPPTAPPAGYVLVPLQPPQPTQSAPLPQPQAAHEEEQEEPTEEDAEYPLRRFVIGVGPFVHANVHWLDKPGHRSVTVNQVRGDDRQYPGFVGVDAGFGLMLDLRYRELLGLELDVSYQNDRGQGTVKLRNRGDICYIPTGKVTYETDSYDITIGQRAWHVPLLAKLSLPRDTDTVVVDGKRRVVVTSWTTLAFGPEFVFPEDAKLEIDPEGLTSPRRAEASNYVMYTAALGWEWRVARRIDLRLFGSLRGSFNPEPKNSVRRRASYELESGEVVAASYRSEWRYQLGAAFGLGWFF